MPTPPVIADPPSGARALAVLMMGNSHTAFNDLPAMLARARQSVPVMFPEWARVGIDETQRIYACTSASRNASRPVWRPSRKRSTLQSGGRRYCPDDAPL